LAAVIRVQLSEPRPAMFLINSAGVPHYLFGVATEAEAAAKLARLEDELDVMGVAAFLERYHVPGSFLEQLEPHRRRSRLEPML